MTGVETIVHKAHQKEVNAYKELLKILSEEEKERIFMMIETAKMLKLTIKNMEQRGA